MINNINRTWAEVSIDALYHNLSQFQQLLRKDCKLMAVVKADAYGHGACEIAKILANNGVSYFGVAFFDEAKQLRQSGINQPILILGHTPAEVMGEVVELNLTPTVYNFSMAKALSNAAQKKNTVAKAHVKIDTGMGRIGYLFNDNNNEETVEAIADLTHLPNLELEGIFSHLSSADEETDTYSHIQFERFMQLIKLLEQRGIHFSLRHIVNSAGIMCYPEMHLDMVRLGISLYGLYPSNIQYKAELMPVMQLKTIITNIKKLGAGQPISYGRTYCTEREQVIATLPIGYADGYSRLLSGKARVIVGGEYADVVGKICMDQCMIDISHVNNINIEDEVTLFGNKDGLSIPIYEVAEKMGTIPYELLCVIGKRVPRIYLSRGSVMRSQNNLVQD